MTGHAGWTLGHAGLQPGDPHEIGPYRLLGELGSGGMGRVFLGLSAGGRPIAVKVIRTDLAADPEFRARFRREVAAARKVSGLFTALVVDADLDGPVPWLATAYVAGPSLSEAVRGHGPLPSRTLLALTAGLAEGLNGIHAAGVVHRDLKPANVLLAEDGPRIIDFGISQAAEASAVTGANLLIGSPGFMSPEQVLGYDIGPPSDVFSLGAVLTFAATGRGPFGSGSPAALMYRLVNSPPELDGVPGELRSLVESCLAKHPGDRPGARELLAQVDAIQPAPGWLGDSIIGGLDPERPPAGPFGLAEAVNGAALTVTAADRPPPGRPARPGRHRISRPLASAGISAGLLAASAVAAFAMIGAGRAPAAPHDLPQATAGAVATSPAPASARPGSPRSASSSLSPPASSSPSSSVTPSAFLTPAGSGISSSSGPPSFSSSPSASPTTSPSAKPSKSPSSSPSSSASPSSSPSGSTSSSASPSASTSPSSSSPAASTSPSSSSPAASPSSSSPSASATGSASSPAATASASSSPAATGT